MPAVKTITLKTPNLYTFTMLQRKIFSRYKIEIVTLTICKAKNKYRKDKSKGLLRKKEGERK